MLSRPIKGASVLLRHFEYKIDPDLEESDGQHDQLRTKHYIEGIRQFWKGEMSSSLNRMKHLRKVIYESDPDTQGLSSMKKLEQEVVDEHDLLLKRKSAFGDSLSELKKLNEHQLSSRLKADVAELVELVEAVASFIEEEIITLKESEKVLQDKISIVATKIQLAESIKKMEAGLVAAKSTKCGSSKKKWLVEAMVEAQVLQIPKEPTTQPSKENSRCV